VLRVAPERALVDKPFTVRLAGVPPRARVTLSARLRDDAGYEWTSSATFVASAAGAVDASADPSVDGSYTGVSPMGLVWSMRSSPDASNPMLFRTRLDPLEIAIEASTEGEILARATAQRLSVAPDVRRTEVRARGLVGTLFEPAGARPHPAVVVLGGSGGGLSESIPALLASHGIAGLALAYFGSPGVPDELAGIPLEYFETAFEWLRARPSINGDALGVAGSSRGGELSLLLGATFPFIRAVVAWAPSAVVYGSVRREGRGGDPAWLHHGEAVPWFQPAQRPAPPPSGPPPEGGIPLTPAFLKGLEDADAVERARIPVERINGPVLMISGKDDQMWPSPVYGDMVMERLARHGHAYRNEHLVYPGCGHLVNFPYVPTTVLASVHPVTKHLFAYGGTPEGQARAREESWPKVITFFLENLR
jgi:dienelactone hydrolase